MAPAGWVELGAELSPNGYLRCSTLLYFGVPEHAFRALRRSRLRTKTQGGVIGLWLADQCLGRREDHMVEQGPDRSDMEETPVSRDLCPVFERLLA